MGVIIRQSIKGTIVNYAGVGIGVITNFFVLTHYLTAEQIGITRVMVDAAVILATLAQLGTSVSIIRFYPHFADRESKDHGFFFWTLIVPFIGITIFSLLFICLQAPVSVVFQEKSALFVDYYFYVIPIAFFVLYTSTFESVAIALRRIVAPKIIREVVVRALLLVGYLLFAFHIISLNELIVSLSLIYALAMLLNIIYLIHLKRISIKPNFSFITKKLRKEYFSYTLFIIVGALGTAAFPFLNAFFISSNLGLEFTGVFAIAFYIVGVIEIPARALYAIAQPSISEPIRREDYATATQLSRQISLHQLLSCIFIFLLIWINIDTLFAIMPNGDQFKAGKWVVFILGLSRLLTSSYGTAGSILNYSKKYRASLIFTTLLLVSAIILNWLFIPQWGMEGAAFATLLSSFLCYSLLYLFNYIQFKNLPLGGEQLKVFAVGIAIFAINAVSVHFLTPKFLLLPIKDVHIYIGDSIIRTALTLGGGVYIVYKWNISESVNSLLRKYIALIQKKAS